MYAEEIQTDKRDGKSRKGNGMRKGWEGERGAGVRSKPIVQQLSGMAQGNRQKSSLLCAGD